MSPSDQTTGPVETACANCGAQLAADQRYCLECGARRADVAPPYAREAAPAPAAEPAAPAPAATAATPSAQPPRRDFSPLTAVLGIALLGGMLLIGVLLGREGSDDDPPPAQTIQVGEGQTTTTSTPEETDTPEPPATGAIVSEWPGGTDGFTIRLQALPKADTTSADVEAAKSELTAQGASALGVLDSDLYPSLPPGEYVIYSGVYTDRAAANAALEPLQASIPAAALARVSATPAQGAKPGGE